MSLPEQITNMLAETFINIEGDWRLRLLVWFVIFGFLAWFFFEEHKVWAMLLAYTPTLVVDLIHSYGTFVFALPFGLTFTMDKGFLTLTTLDFFFNFEIFKQYGLGVFNSVNGAQSLDTVQTAAIWVFMYIDSLILFLLIAYVLYEFVHKLDIAIMGALIPVVAMAIYFNPVKEMTTATSIVRHTIYFFSHANEVQLLIVLATATISFLIVVVVINTGINLFVGVGKRTVKPGWETSEWETSFAGIAFMISAVYGIAQILHPEYKWFISIPVLIIFGIIKSTLGGYAEERRAERREDDRVRRIAEEVRR